MKKTILFLLLFVSNCVAQYNPQFLTQPPVGYQINLAHPDAQPLVGFWFFNEGLGSTVYDLSVNGNDGILTNMVPADDWVAGRDGWALDFENSDDYIEIPNSDVLDSSYPSSISFWINLTTYGGATDGSIITRYANAGTENNDKRGFRTDTNDFFITEETINRINLNTWVTVGSWHFVTLTLSEAKAAVAYVDGIERATSTFVGTWFNTDRVVRLGAPETVYFSSGVEAFPGQLADVRFYNRRLTAQEVWSLYVNPYAMFEQPPGRILEAAAVAATRRRNINIL